MRSQKRKRESRAESRGELVLSFESVPHEAWICTRTLCTHSYTFERGILPSRLAPIGTTVPITTSDTASSNTNMRSSRAAKTAAASKITESMRPKTVAQLALSKERSSSVEEEPVDAHSMEKGRIHIIPVAPKQPTINEEEPVDEDGYMSEDREEEIIVRNDIEGASDAETAPSAADILAANLDSTPLRNTPMVGILKNRLDSPLTVVANSGGGGNGGRRSAHRVHFDPTSDRVTRFSKSPDKRPHPATPATALVPLSFMEEDGGSPPPKQSRAQRLGQNQKSPTSSPQVAHSNEPFLPELAGSEVQITQAMCQVGNYG